MSSLKHEIAFKTGEAMYQLWTSLLTVNGILITILIGLASFGNIENSYLKGLVDLTFLMALISCGLLVWNFILARDYYSKVRDSVLKNVTLSKQEDDERWVNPKIIKQLTLRENIIISFQVIIAIALFIITTYQLYKPH